MIHEQRGSTTMDLKSPGTKHICIGAFFFPQTKRTFYLFKPLRCQIWRGLERNANVQARVNNQLWSCHKVVRLIHDASFYCNGEVLLKSWNSQGQGISASILCPVLPENKTWPLFICFLTDQDKRCVSKHIYVSMFRNCSAQVFFAWHVQVYQLILNLNCNDEVLPDIRISRG